MKAILEIDVPNEVVIAFCKATVVIKENAFFVKKDEVPFKYSDKLVFENIPLKPAPITKEKQNESNTGN